MKEVDLFFHCESLVKLYQMKQKIQRSVINLQVTKRSIER